MKIEKQQQIEAHVLWYFLIKFSLVILCVKMKNKWFLMNLLLVGPNKFPVQHEMKNQTKKPY